jgi:hypothetical protein
MNKIYKTNQNIQNYNIYMVRSMAKIELASFLLRLGLLFIPGIIARLILGRLLFYKSDDTFYFVVHSFMLGCVSYAFLYLISSFYNAIIPSCSQQLTVTFLDALQHSCVDINFKEVLFSSIISIPVAIVISYCESEKILTRFAQKINISHRFGEPDVWGYLLDSSEFASNPWVSVRLKDRGLVYQGKVLAYSDTYKEAELLLGNVIVFNNDTGLELYKTASVYLTLNPNDIEVECLNNNSETINDLGGNRGKRKSRRRIR